jgi:AcrR family transcriptional regulator
MLPVSIICYFCRVISQSTKDKRKDILAAALKLFVENGFHGTPTSRIAKEAGVANGTLFHYYPTKEDLIVSLYIDIKTRMGEYLYRHTEHQQGPKATFRSQFTEVILWSLEHRNEFYFLQQFQSSPFTALLSEEDVKKQLSKSCHEIEEAIKAKAIRARDAEFILALMGSHVFGLSHYLTKTKLSKKKQMELIEDGFEMLWKMIE